MTGELTRIQSAKTPTDAADVDHAFSEALASNGPALVEIAVDDATADLFSHPR
ncbi:MULTISPECIES: hypothetical protein [Bradyrhizobium]|uniref:hypothetical protein n=1 Tax=Bradyrhizobium TaxID=374 RepID=UPI0003F90945|nr:MULTISPECIES: hypothetical protein [Bradyrhizobium]QOG20313.1 hypothetical protein FOM02_26175 [Bradyrhizobium sp. SEMIA]UFW52659.1 hypothetical protein BaraCB756_17375 [Bradyrhizobium arachidis]